MMKMSLKDKDFQRTSKLERICKQKKRVQDPRFGSISIVQNPKTKELLALREIKEGKKDLASKRIIKCRKLMQNRHPNLLNLKDYSVTKQSELCSTNYIIKEFYEYPRSDMKREIKERSKKGETFNDKELTHILYQQVQANSYLQAKGQTHGNIQPLHIAYNKIDKTSKLIHTTRDQGTSLKMKRQLLRNKLKSKNDLYMTPKTFENLYKGNLNYKNNQAKEDTFTLGLTMLESGNGHSIQNIYNKKKGTFDKVALQKHIDNFNNKFGHENLLLVSTVSTMVNLNEEERPDPRGLETTMPNYNEVKSFLDKNENNVNSQAQQQPPMVNVNKNPNQNTADGNFNNNIITENDAKMQNNITENDSKMQNYVNSNNNSFNYDFSNLPYYQPSNSEVPIQNFNPSMLKKQERQLQSGVPMNLPQKNNVENMNLKSNDFQKQNHMVQNSVPNYEIPQENIPLLRIPEKRSPQQNIQTDHMNQQNKQSNPQQQYVQSHPPQQLYQNQQSNPQQKYVQNHPTQQLYQNQQSNPQQQYVQNNQPQPLYQNEIVVQNHQPQPLYQNEIVVQNHQPQQLYQQKEYVQNHQTQQVYQNQVQNHQPQLVYQNDPQQQVYQNQVQNHQSQQVYQNNPQQQVYQNEIVYQNHQPQQVVYQNNPQQQVYQNEIVYQNHPQVVVQNERVVQNHQPQQVDVQNHPPQQSYQQEYVQNHQPQQLVVQNHPPQQLYQNERMVKTQKTSHTKPQVERLDPVYKTEYIPIDKEAEKKRIMAKYGGARVTILNPEEKRVVNNNQYYEVQNQVLKNEVVRTNETPIYTTGNNNYIPNISGLKKLRTYEDYSHVRN